MRHGTEDILVMVDISNKKLSILWVIILFVITICCLLYSRPLLLSRSIKNETTNHLEKLNFEVITDKHMSEYFHYLDSNKNYDYYCVAEYDPVNSSVILSTYLYKICNNTVISKYDLSNLSNKSLLYVQNGVCDSNYLYFTVHGVNGIYRIDVDFTSCELYVESSKYGDVSYSSLNLYSNELMYITDLGNIVKSSDSNEELISTIPTLKSVFSSDAINFNGFLMQYNYTETANYQICSNEEKIFCAAKNKLFVYGNGEDELKEINIRLPKSAYIQKIKFSNESENTIFIFYTVYSAPWEGQTNHIAVYNIDSGGKRAFKQEPKYQFRIWKTQKSELTFGSDNE